MVRGIRRRNRRGRSILSARGAKLKKIRAERLWVRAYSAELGEERDDVRAASALKLLFEEIDIYEDIRHCVFVHHCCISIREEILIANKKNSEHSVRGTQKRKTHHEALSDVGCCGVIRLVFVRIVNLERVDDGREPVDELVEIHARCVLARRGRPDVLGETEEVVELEVDQ